MNTNEFNTITKDLDFDTKYIKSSDFVNFKIECEKPSILIFYAIEKLSVNGELIRSTNSDYREERIDSKTYGIVEKEYNNKKCIIVISLYDLTENERNNVYTKVLLQLFSNDESAREKLLTVSINKMVNDFYRAEIDAYERDKTYWEEQKKGFKRRLIEACDNLYKITHRNLDSEKNELLKRLTEDISNIIKHPKVTDAYITERKIFFTVKDIVTTEHYTRRKYYIGNIKVSINIKDGEINIKNLNNCRNGFWERSPFPHVSTRGQPCLGNIEAQIAQYISEKMYYSVFCTILNYLEHGVDIDDCAGWRVCVWDEVDDEGKIIKTGHNPRHGEYDGNGYENEYEEQCELCGALRDSEDMYRCPECGRTVCYYCWDNDADICIHCAEENRSDDEPF